MSNIIYIIRKSPCKKADIRVVNPFNQVTNGDLSLASNARGIF